MTKNVELTDLLVNYIRVDYEHQRVFVDYKLVDSAGKAWDKGEAIFWLNMPPEPSENDFQLPPGYVQTFIDLRNDADTALTNRFLV